MKRTHGFTGTPLYASWASMKGRYLNPADTNFKYYGERGISTCTEWLNFINFKNDMHESYCEHKTKHSATTLERINTNGNYCPKNCRWATYDEQSLNKQKPSLYNAPSLQKCIVAKSKGNLICKRCGHAWWPRINRQPQMCPTCKSRKWNKDIEKSANIVNRENGRKGKNRGKI